MLGPVALDWSITPLVGLYSIFIVGDAGIARRGGSLARSEFGLLRESAALSNYDRLLSTFAKVKSARGSDVTDLIVSELTRIIITSHAPSAAQVENHAPVAVEKF